MINIEVYSTHAVIRAQQPLTVGLTGAKVHFTFDDLWKPLNKTAVFRCGETTVSVVIADGEQVQIPWEVLTQPGVPVRIGVYGTCDEGKLTIPTVWAETDAVEPGADPEDAAFPVDPTAPVWAQLQSQMGSLEHLQTDDKTSLVAAVNEANRSVVVVKVLGSAGSYSTEHTILDLIEAWNAGKSLVCYWEEQDCWLPVSKAHPKETGPSTFCFSTTAFGKLYSVQIKGMASGGAVSVTVGQATVATAQSKLPNPQKLKFIGNATAEYDGSEEVTVGIPTKVSQLTNDSNFLTEAVTSVNGQTGDVTLSTALVVTVTKQADGSYVSDKTAAELRTAHNAGETLRCWCYDDDVYLPLTYCHGGFTFSAAVNQYLYQLTINAGGNSETKVLFSKTDLSSGGADGLLFDQTAGMLYLTKDGQITGTGVQLPTAEGGPTNNAVLTVENTSGWAEKTVANDAECMISFHWSSTEGGVSTGSGTLVLKVNQALKYSTAIKQGEHTIDISQYLSLGENLVHVCVTDFYGNSQYITFGLNVYDPATLKSPKLVERTLTGDYTNDRVTKVFSDAFHGLTLDRLELPNVTELDARAFAGCKANELVLASFTTLNSYAFWECDIGVVKLPSVVEAGDRCLFGSKIGRIIFNSLETLGTPVRVFADIKIFDFHQLTSLWDLIPKNDPAYSLIIRTPTVCALQNEATDTKATLYVPSALVADYKAATNWSAMADRIFAIEDHPEICEVNENV